MTLKRPTVVRRCHADLRPPAKTHFMIRTSSHANLGMDSYSGHVQADISIKRDESKTNRLPKAASKRKRRIDDIPWTASRCNRLLRTITSRIHILQRLSASNRIPSSQETDQAHHTISALIDGPAFAPVWTPSKDPEWFPSASRAVKTYGGRKSGKHLESKPKVKDRRAVRDDLGLSTPFVRRMLKPDSSESLLAPRDELSTNARVTVEAYEAGALGTSRREETRKRMPKLLPLRPTTTADEAYLHLTTSLSSFLHATKPQGPDKRVGTSSLKSVCLRKVPEYIQDLETEQREESCDEDVRDMTYDIYTELEALGTTGSAGLRETVRAHGIWHIERAILDKLIPARTIEELILVCQQAVEAGAEARRLSNAVLQASPTKRAFQSALLTHDSSSSLILQSLDHLLDQPNLALAQPLSDLCQQQGYRRMLLQASIDEMRSTEVIALSSALSRMNTNQVTAAASKQSRDMARQLAASFAAIAVSCGASGTRYAETVHRSATLAVLEAHETEQTTTESGSTPFLLASVLLQVDKAAAESNLQFAGLKKLAAQVSHGVCIQVLGPQNAKGTTTFVSDVANIIGRFDAAAGDHYLFDTTHKLIRAASVEPESVASSLLRRMALDGAAAYAEKRQSKESHLFVEEIEDVILHGAKLATATTPAAKPKHDYWWEEGLCEWIAKTPVIVREVEHVGSGQQLTLSPSEMMDDQGGLTDDTLLTRVDDPDETDSDELALSMRKPKVQKKRKLDCSSIRLLPFRPSRTRTRKRPRSGPAVSSSWDYSFPVTGQADDDELSI